MRALVVGGGCRGLDLARELGREGHAVRYVTRSEEGRVAIRNVRRDVMQDLRELREAGEAGADDEHRAEGELQKLTDERVADLDSHLKGKEAEILEV